MKKRTATKLNTQRTLPGVQHMTIMGLIVLSLFASVADGLKFNRTYVLCGSGRNGHTLSIPHKIQCKMPKNRPLQKKMVRLWIQRDEPIRTPAFRCYLQHHSIFTRVGLFWSKGIVGDQVKYTAVAPKQCWEAVQVKSWQGHNLIEIMPGFWSTNKTLFTRYKFCCNDFENSVTNFQLEEGEIASVDGERLVTDLQDISGCSSAAGDTVMIPKESQFGKVKLSKNSVATEFKEIT